MASASDPSADSPSSMLRDHWPWFVVGIATLVVMYLLAPILSPFIIGAVFAYLFDPLVDRLEARRVPRAVGVGLLFVVATFAAVLGLVLIGPMLQSQARLLIDNLPVWVDWIETVALPALGITLPKGYQLDVDSLKRFVTSHWDGTTDIVSLLASYVGKSTPALLGLIANLFLIPIVSFYLLRDWDLMVARLRSLIPRRLGGLADTLALETDSVLSALIRGQLLVMLALAVIYSLGLWIIGLKVALLIGLLSGLVSFVPYLGFAGGLVAAGIAMLVQEQALLPLVWVVLVFTIGQMLEGGVLTPWLVGDRIGLHPVAVIFAVMAGGQLFGFVGVLAALPVAAVLAVLFRHLLASWLKSPLYLRGAEADAIATAPALAPSPPPSAAPAAADSAPAS